MTAQLRQWEVTRMQAQRLTLLPSPFREQVKRRLFSLVYDAHIPAMLLAPMKEEDKR